jgi:hypothetical protein
LHIAGKFAVRRYKQIADKELHAKTGRLGSFRTFAVGSLRSIRAWLVARPRHAAGATSSDLELLAWKV